jgi:thiol-disulfide isomerase/thioredoxin
MPPPERRLTTLLGVLCIGLALLVVGAAGLPERAAYSGFMLDGQYVAPEIGALAPPIEGVLVSGESFSLADRRGETVLLNFWATWCGPCEAEMPALQALAEACSGECPQIIGVNLGEDPATVQPWLRERGITFPTVLDRTGEMAQAYRLRGQPSSYLITPSGHIAAIYYGIIDEAAMRALFAPAPA